MPVTRITSVAVLGAGTMGAQIAAHFANAGVPALLLDLDARVAREGFERARKLKPDPLFGADVASLVSFGGFDTDLPRLAGADWIIEAVVERLDVKQALLARVDDVRRPGTFVSSNTSGISIREIAAGTNRGLPRALARHAFLQPASLSAPARGHSDSRHRPGRRRIDLHVRGPSARQGRRAGEGHAELHREPRRAARRRAHARRARARRVHGRGDRRDHRPGAGPAEERDVQDARHRRPRRARAGHQESARPVARGGS